MVYSRVVRALKADHLSLISPRRTTIIFVLGDFICLTIQSNGGGLLAHENLVHLGEYLIVGGLVIQVLLFAGFMLCCLTFNLRFRAHEAGGSVPTSNIPWQSCLNMLYATSLAILVRNIYRVVEFIMGNNGYLIDHEWPTYAFDGALMLLVMIGFFIWYPSQLRPSAGDSMIELTTDGPGFGEHGRVVKDLEPME
jgi:RTA1 like protein